MYYRFLDGLRGVSALIVIFWHWKHFFYQNYAFHGILHRLPFYNVFTILYDYGWLAVDVFFILSGFIFFTLYSERINSKRIGLGRFFILRFSRLYPLHFITLIVVMFLQMLYYAFAGEYFVYAYNDVYHFVLNIFMAVAYGFERGGSFNQPIWSVSVELLSYTAFFLYCRWMKPRWIFEAFFVFIAFALLYPFNGLIGRAIGGFFIGASVFRVYSKTASVFNKNTCFFGLVVICFFSWLGAIALYYFDFSIGNLFESVNLYGFASFVESYGVAGFSICFLFPILIYTLAIMDFRGLKCPSFLTFLGNVSYSLYLLHFPLQLAVAIIALCGGISINLMYSELSFITFVVVSLGLSFLSLHFLERPSQRLIRRLTNV